MWQWDHNNSELIKDFLLWNIICAGNTLTVYFNPHSIHTEFSLLLNVLTFEESNTHSSRAFHVSTTRILKECSLKLVLLLCFEILYLCTLVLASSSSSNEMDELILSVPFKILNTRAAYLLAAFCTAVKEGLASLAFVGAEFCNTCHALLCTPSSLFDLLLW